MARRKETTLDSENESRKMTERKEDTAPHGPATFNAIRVASQSSASLHVPQLLTPYPNGTATARLHFVRAYIIGRIERNYVGIFINVSLAKPHFRRAERLDFRRFPGHE
jgi:hypothetical protein